MSARPAAWFRSVYTSVRRIAEGARLRARAYNFGRRVLPRPVRAWVKRVVFREPTILSGSEAILRSVATAPVGTPAALAPSVIGKGATGRGYDVVYFPIVDWEGRVQRSHHLCAQFAARGHRVYYVRTAFEDSSHGTTLRQFIPGVYDLSLPGPKRLSIYRDRLDAQTTERLVQFLDAFRCAEGLCDVVCLVALPFWGPLVRRLKEALGWTVVYDCMDDHAGFETNDIRMVSEEPGLVDCSDLVVATSRPLYDRLSRLTTRCVLIPNAGEFDRFSASVGPAPALYDALPRPVIGYHGAISHWFDSDLVASMARLRPSWSFVLIGSTYGGDVRALSRLPNIRLLGELPYTSLPDHVAQFDACLIPFKVNRLTEAAHPVKVYEYLAASKPVVATPLPELAPLVGQGLVYEGKGEAAFLESVERALSEDDDSRRAARTAFAQQHTWGMRHAALMAAVAQSVPKVSIVVVTHNNAPLTSLCLQSLWEQTSYPNFEVIVVDNGSRDGTVEVLERMRGSREHLRVIVNAENRGFAAATNQGIVAAPGEVLVLLNNDTVVTRGWVGRLVGHLRRDGTIGMVGPVTNFAGNEACIEVPYTSLEEMHAFAGEYARRHVGRLRDLPMLAMFCVALRREVVERVGLLDERFGIGTFEDDDYAVRVRALGYRIVCAEDVFVHHFGRASIGTLDGRGYDTLFERNRTLFERKWTTVWERHRTR